MLQLTNLLPYITAFCVSLVALYPGFSIAWPSPILPKLNERNNSANNPLGRLLTITETTWITTILIPGCIIGAIVAGIAADAIGRKKTVQILACPLVLSYVMMAFATNVTLFLIARIIEGFSIGGIIIIIPLYFAEIAEDHYRGCFGCLYSISNGSGMLFSYLIGPFLNVRYFFLASLIPLAISIPFLWFCSDSPYYFAATNNVKELRHSLSKIRNSTSIKIEDEVNKILKTVQELGQDKVGIKSFFTVKVLRRSTLISTGLIFFQASCGYTVLIPYMQTIFDASGSGLKPEVSTIITGCVQLGTECIASVLVDRLGRRILLLGSTTGCAISLSFVGLYFFLKDNNYQIGTLFWLPITSIAVFIICFSIGLGPVPWAITGEIFSPNVKFKASIVTTIVFLVTIFVSLWCFPVLVLHIGIAASFWLFAAICVSSLIFVFFIVPETKGLSFLDIQKSLA